ncbi:MAG: CDP-glycerol glycerophosphotransferase family protein, partial [bacterium]|nr:CDP-glycerol glycerophosphotransferase family protein [bacterium]
TQLKNGRNLLRFLASLLLMKIFGRFKFILKLSRWTDYLTIGRGQFSACLDNYRPDLVFSTDIFHDGDAHLLAEARARKIKTVGMVRSWDNFTTKGVFRIKPGSLIVQNETMEAEAVKYSGISRKEIVVAGIPQYDRYFSGKRMPRDEFFKKIGLDPKKKLILFSPFGQRFTNTDWQVMEIIKEFIEKKLIPPAQVLVRFTPNDEVPLGKFRPSADFYLDKPGHQFRAGVFRDQELNARDMEWLADSLFSADIVVAGGASIGIDAAVFDKPAILIYFDGFENRPLWQSVRRFFDFSHGKQVTRDGSLKAARSREELLSYLDQCLENPGLDSELRRKLVERMCWRTDGKAGERIAAVILRSL